MRRVVITGMGAVTPLADSLLATWQAAVRGQSGLKSYLNDPVLHNDKPYTLALVPNFQFSKWKVPHAPSRLTSYLAKATSQALANSRFDPETIDTTRAGICLGSLASSNTKLLQQMEESHKDHFKNINRLSMLQILNNIPAGTLNVLYKFQGPSLTVGTACASGLSAIIEAVKWVRLNQADFVIAGASEDVYNPLYLYSSMRIQAMTTKAYQKPQEASRPFDKDRSGFVLGQGAGILIVQSLEHAQRRGAPIIAQVLGYGYTSDGFHLVRPADSGHGQIRAMKNALQASNISYGQIDLINTHATSTLAGDQIQARSIKTLLGKHASRPIITAIKGFIGHTFAAAGAIQTILGLISLQKSLALKIPNLKSYDVQGLHYAQSNIERQMKIMLKNSFGFGGINASCVFRRYD